MDPLMDLEWRNLFIVLWLLRTRPWTVILQLCAGTFMFYSPEKRERGIGDTISRCRKLGGQICVHPCGSSIKTTAQTL